MDASAIAAVDTAAVDTALDGARFAADGLLPAVIQQWDTREVLMVGYMNREALRRTLTEGRVTFWSRSRSEYWRKGDTSGNIQLVRSAAFDCDADAVLVAVEQVGPACHTGAHACFDVQPLPAAVLPDGAHNHAVLPDGALPDTNAEAPA